MQCYGSFDSDGRVCIDAIRNLHTQAIDTFNVPNNTRREVNELLDECESMLNGVRLIQELSPKSLDQLVSQHRATYRKADGVYLTAFLEHFR